MLNAESLQPHASLLPTTRALLAPMDVYLRLLSASTPVVPVGLAVPQWEYGLVRRGLLGTGSIVPSLVQLRALGTRHVCGHLVKGWCMLCFDSCLSWSQACPRLLQRCRVQRLLTHARAAAVMPRQQPAGAATANTYIANRVQPWTQLVTGRCSRLAHRHAGPPPAPVPVLAAGARLPHAYPVLRLSVGGAPQVEEVVLNVELLRQGVPEAAAGCSVSWQVQQAKASGPWQDKGPGSTTSWAPSLTPTGTLFRSRQSMCGTRYRLHACAHQVASQPLRGAAAHAVCAAVHEVAVATSSYILLLGMKRMEEVLGATQLIMEGTAGEA